MPLQYKVWYSIRESATRNAPAGLEDLKIVPTSHVLIYGERDAVLVDTALLEKDNLALIEWIKGFSKNLKYIYVTHPHGDHYFGLDAILKEFPNAKAIATKECVEHMLREIENENGANPRFKAWFPNRVAETIIPAEALESDTFTLEDEVFQIVPTGHTDTDETSTLFVPSIRLAVTGDSVYNNVHPFMMETETREKLDAWLEGLDKVEALQPLRVVGGHKDPEREDSFESIGETKSYFADLLRLRTRFSDREELYRAMLELHPTRLNPGSLWGATAVVLDPKFDRK